MIYSIVNELTTITIFASVFSILSIALSVFDYVSASLLLNTETVLIIKLELASKQLVRLPMSTFRKIVNHRYAIVRQLSKVIDVDVQLIELSIPVQTKDGISLTFYIHGEMQQKDAYAIRKLLVAQVKSGYLSKAFCDVWNKIDSSIKSIPKISNIEIQQTKPHLSHVNDTGVASVDSLVKYINGSVKSSSETLGSAGGHGSGENFGHDELNSKSAIAKLHTRVGKNDEDSDSGNDRKNDVDVEMGYFGKSERNKSNAL